MLVGTPSSQPDSRAKCFLIHGRFKFLQADFTEEMLFWKTRSFGMLIILLSLF